MKVVNQFGERTDFSLQRGNGVRGKLAYAILNGLQFTAQHRQRRTQFVRNIGHKVTTHLLVFFQRTGELVEVLRQLAQLIRTGWRNASGEIARCQFVRAFHQPLNRGQQAARQRKRRQRCQDRGERNDKPTGSSLLHVEIDIRIPR